MAKKRLQFAKDYARFTEIEWRKIFFSDECTLQCLTASARYVRRQKHEKFDPTCVLSTVKHPPSVMVWGVISGSGPGPLYFVQGTMRQNQYIDVLKNVFLSYFNEQVEEESFYYFMQDNAPCHTARSVKTFLDKENIPLLSWPGNAPDLNPIENVWNVLKRLVYERRNPDKQTLVRNITEIWHGAEEIKNCITVCIDSMPRRIASVIKARGGITKY